MESLTDNTSNFGFLSDFGFRIFLGATGTAKNSPPPSPGPRKDSSSLDKQPCCRRRSGRPENPTPTRTRSSTQSCPAQRRRDKPKLERGLAAPGSARHRENANFLPPRAKLRCRPRREYDDDAPRLVRARRDPDERGDANGGLHRARARAHGSRKPSARPTIQPQKASPRPDVHPKSKADSAATNRATTAIASRPIPRPPNGRSPSAVPPTNLACVDAPPGAQLLRSSKEAG